jgi:drug/metabolite transporter (DMT)-like permease
VSEIYAVHSVKIRPTHTTQIFFALNLVFNGIMWTLFTKALTHGTSTTQVSILNTSSNFMLTAMLGFVVFSESLPPLWWLGAALLVTGNVIIGRREEKDPEEERSDGLARAESGEDGEGLLGQEIELGADGRESEDEDVLDLREH